MRASPLTAFSFSMWFLFAEAWTTNSESCAIPFFWEFADRIDHYVPDIGRGLYRVRALPALELVPASHVLVVLLEGDGHLLRDYTSRTFSAASCPQIPYGVADGGQVLVAGVYLVALGWEMPFLSMLIEYFMPTSPRGLASPRCLRFQARSRDHSLSRERKLRQAYVPSVSVNIVISLNCLSVVNRRTFSFRGQLGG